MSESQENGVAVASPPEEDYMPSPPSFGTQILDNGGGLLVSRETGDAEQEPVTRPAAMPVVGDDGVPLSTLDEPVREKAEELQKAEDDAAQEDAEEEGEPEADDEQSKLLDWAKRFRDGFTRDPAAMLAAMLKDAAMGDPTFAQRVLDQAGVAAPPSGDGDVSLADYEPESDLEKVILPHMDFVTQGRKAIAEIAEVLRDHAVTRDMLYARSELVADRLEALERALGISVPDDLSLGKYVTPEVVSSQDHFQKARQKYVAQLKKLHSVASQKRDVVRPDTLRGRSAAGESERAKPKDFAAIWRETKAEMGIG